MVCREEEQEEDEEDTVSRSRLFASEREARSGSEDARAFAGQDYGRGG